MLFNLLLPVKRTKFHFAADRQYRESAKDELTFS
jgi:hypothetical protein